ncbi:hypothetical protein [Glutamicibacter arilaitensis]|uniref:hypothetical protein n=1 Tax=Glutamicibacter arilaitensis TaxID=256701 RepID=UPI003FD0382B
MREIDNTEPTQVQQPGRAAARTFWQTFIPALIGLVFILPEVLGILSSELGDSLPPALRAWLLGAAVVVSGIASALAKIMAIPAVNRWLEHIRLGAGLAPVPSRPDVGN